MSTVNVDLPANGYPIYIGENLLDQPDLILPFLSQKKVAIITNETIAPLYLAQLKNALTQIGVESLDIILPDGESYKNTETLNIIYDQLLLHRCERKTTLIALGGGVIGDMTGFAAATFLRGIPFIQIPTTLLSQVDSSVGGKTGVNHPRGKNMIGAFYQPKLVLADTLTLTTLADRELSAGLAEVIKYGLIRDLPFFEWLEENIEKLLARDPAALNYAIARSCENKAETVIADEREQGIRAYLNLGHTFGHAVEASQGYGVWLHGEAVGLGMLLAAQLSQLLGHLDDLDVERVRRILLRAKLPVDPTVLNMSFETWMQYMNIDKKVEQGKVRFVLLKQLGDAFITSDVPEALLRQILTTHR